MVAALFMAEAQTRTQETPSQGPRDFQVTAQRYDFSPSVIKVKHGDRVRLIITALDREHGFKLEAFHIERKLPKGEAVTIEFTADHAGSFAFQCSHFCGLKHSQMKGQLTVE
jgi:heme/copper-type cytochrome/quinol oxidase subunit 2